MLIWKVEKKNAKSKKKKQGADIQIHVEKKAHNFFIQYPNSKKQHSLES